MSSSAPRVLLFSYTGAYSVSLSSLVIPQPTLIASAFFLSSLDRSCPVGQYHRSRVTTRRSYLLFVHALPRHSSMCRVYKPHVPSRLLTLSNPPNVSLPTYSPSISHSSNPPLSPFLPCVLPYIFLSSPRHFLHLWFIPPPSRLPRTTTHLRAPPRKRCLTPVALVACCLAAAL
jgi:hypothetical protein